MGLDLISLRSTYFGIRLAGEGFIWKKVFHEDIYRPTNHNLIPGDYSVVGDAVIAEISSNSSQYLKKSTSPVISIDCILHTAS